MVSSGKFNEAYIFCIFQIYINFNIKSFLYFKSNANKKIKFFRKEEKLFVTLIKN